MQKYSASVLKHILAKFLSIAIFSSFIVLPHPNATALAPGVDVYFFVGDETGGRYAVKSNGDGTFGPVAFSFIYGDNNRGGALEDFDEDGDMDFVGCNDDMNFCHLLIQTTPGVFVQSTSVEPSGVSLVGVESGMAADDFDQDGHADVVFGGNSNLAKVYAGDGAGGFTKLEDNLLPVIPDASSYREKDTGDLDGNGYPDVIIGVVPSGQVYSYLNTAGTFSGPFLLFDTTGASNSVFALTTADFDGDGFLDIITGGATDGDVALWKGNGTGNSSTSFALVGTVYDFDTQSAVDSYDFDGDSDQDLVAVKRSTGGVYYFEGKGDGTFAAAVALGEVTARKLPAASSTLPMQGSRTWCWNLQGRIIWATPSRFPRRLRLTVPTQSEASRSTTATATRSSSPPLPQAMRL